LRNVPAGRKTGRRGCDARNPQPDEKPFLAHWEPAYTRIVANCTATNAEGAQLRVQASLFAALLSGNGLNLGGQLAQDELL
jgi:hypothetical protein